MNPHSDSVYAPSSADAVDRFTAVLHGAGVRVTVRHNRGADIDAACGQLALRGGAGVDGHSDRAAPDGDSASP